MKDKEFLPLGSVVLLNGGIHELLIIGYCPNVVKKSGKVKTFDYSAVLFPEGLLNVEQIVAFNQSDIARVSFTGYKNKASETFMKNMTKVLSKVATVDKKGNILMDPKKMTSNLSELWK